MFIKCEYNVHGCEKTDKVCEILKHEKNCQFKKFTCHHQECMKETNKDGIKKHNESCPFANYVCSEGCGRNMKLFEVKTLGKFFKFIRKISRELLIIALNGYII